MWTDMNSLVYDTGDYQAVDDPFQKTSFGGAEKKSPI